MSAETADLLRRAWHALGEGRNAEAHGLVLQVLGQPDLTPAHRSDALALRGVIKQCEPTLDIDVDDSALEWFKEAVALDPANIDAWGWILTNFGTMHLDHVAAREAFRALLAYDGPEADKFAKWARRRALEVRLEERAAGG